MRVNGARRGDVRLWQGEVVQGKAGGGGGGGGEGGQGGHRQHGRRPAVIAADAHVAVVQEHVHVPRRTQFVLVPRRSQSLQAIPAQRAMLAHHRFALGLHQSQSVPCYLSVS